MTKKIVYIKRAADAKKDKMLELPQKINALLNGKPYKLDGIGKSGSTIAIYDDAVLKIEGHSKEVDDTIAVTRYLGEKISVPTILAYEVLNGKAYTLMSRMKGKMAQEDFYQKNTDLHVKLLSSALKKLWTIDVKDFPVKRDLEWKLCQARENVMLGKVDVADCEPTTFAKNGFSSPMELLIWLENNKPDIEPVLSHGDFCLPNIFLDGEKVAGYIDLDNACVCDKWQDIAICFRSLRSNTNGSHGAPPVKNFDPERLFSALGLKPDWDKINYFLLLDELF